MRAINILLYDLGIRLYYAAVSIAASRNAKARKWLAGRQGMLDKLAQELADKTAPRVWMHVSSLGEFEQGRPLIEKIKEERPDVSIILTFFSPSGYEVRKNYAPAEGVYYLPLDTAAHARAFIDIVDPKLVIFVKYDFWYHYITETGRRQIPFILISALFRPSQPFFKWYGSLYREMLPAFSHIFVQDETSARLLGATGYTRTTVTPDTRIDRVNTIAAQAKHIPSLEMFLAGEKAFIGGSVYDKENQLIAQAYKLGKIKGKIILAPHKVDKGHIQEILNRWEGKAALYSQLHRTDNIAGYDVLIIDTIGLLSSAYLYGHIAFVGGGFGIGIHNTLEPAAFGLPVIFGPRYHMFTEAHALLAAGGAFVVANADEFNDVLQELSHEKACAKAAQATKDFIVQNTGGTGHIYQWLLDNRALPARQ